MNAGTNKEEDKGQSLFDAFSALVNGLELEVVIGSKPEAGAVHLVLPTSTMVRL